MKNSVTIDGVTYYREQPEIKETKQVLEKYNWLVHEIKQAREHAQALYDDMKKDGLSFGSIESEGYLRAAIQLDEQAKYIEKVVK